MKRRIFNLLAAVSLVLCAATAVMWVRSYNMRDALFWNSPEIEPTYWHVNSLRGRILIYEEEWRVESSKPYGWSYSSGLYSGSEPDLWHPSVWKAIGVEWGSKMSGIFTGPDRGKVTFWLRIRWSTLAGLFAIAPLIIWLSFLRARTKATRRKQGLCAKCGYDLRASKERCPECGTAIPAAGGAGGK